MRQIEEDVDSLQEVMDRLDVKPDRVKEAMGWTAEKLGRLKLNGQLLGYSPLSRLVELEGLMLGDHRQARAVDRAELGARRRPAARGHRPRAARERAREQRRRSSACGARPRVEALT